MSSKLNLGDNLSVNAAILVGTKSAKENLDIKSFSVNGVKSTALAIGDFLNGLIIISFSVLGVKSSEFSINPGLYSVILSKSYIGENFSAYDKLDLLNDIVSPYKLLLLHRPVSKSIPENELSI